MPPGLQTLETPAIERRAQVADSSIDAEARTVEIVWSTGAEVRRDPWFGDPYVEVLSMDPAHVRMERMQSGCMQLLDGHMMFGSVERGVLGVIEANTGSLDSESGIGTCKARFARTESVEETWQNVRDRILRNVSVSYIVHKYREEPPEKEGDLKRRVAIDWEPLEVSLVKVPADGGANVRSEGAQQYRCVIERAAESQAEGQVMPPEDQPTTEARTEEGASQTTTETPSGGDEAERSQGGGGSTENADQGSREGAQPSTSGTDALERARQEERQRAQEIRAEVRRVSLPEELADTLVATGRQLSEVRAQIIDAVAERDEGPNIHRPIDITRDEGSTQRAALTNWLMHRCDPEATELTDPGRDFIGRSLVEVCRDLLERRGVRTAGMSRSAIAHRSLQSTSDFAGILENVGGKTLLDAYDGSPKTFASFVRETTNPDFKPVKRMRLGDSPRLQPLNEKGEFKRGTMGEEGESYKIDPNGVIVGFTREALINDDLGAFAEVIGLMGDEARELEADLVYAILTGNPNMADGKALFHADHNNTITGALDVTSLSAARTALRLQKRIGDPGKHEDEGRPMNSPLATVIVPATLQTAAEQLLLLTTVPNEIAKTNPFRGSVEIVVEARLDADSITRWYAAAPKRRLNMIELARLEGEQGPEFRMREGFDTDGVEYRVRYDVGVKPIDYRGLVRSTGA